LLVPLAVQEYTTKYILLPLDYDRDLSVLPQFLLWQLYVFFSLYAKIHKRYISQDGIAGRDMIEIKELQKVSEQGVGLAIDELVVSAGEIAALIGPVGSGRDLLLELLIGRSRPTSGTIHLAGIDPRIDRNRFSQAVGVLFYEDGLYARQSVRANLEFQCRLYGLPKDKLEKVLNQTGLGDQGKARVDKLPSGLARRLAFARAVLHEPEVLILVEPFARCDETSRAFLSSRIRDMADDGKSVLILAEDTANLDRLCDTIYQLEQGRIVDSYRPQADTQSALPFKIPVRLEGKVALVNPADILFVEYESGCAFLQTGEGRLPTQFTLNELETRLARSGFFRAHRSYLVNLQHVKEVIPYTRNSFSLRLDDPASTMIPLSKSAAGELRELLGY
jgi:ABC-2 type transport system ATP-binding protein